MCVYVGEVLCVYVGEVCVYVYVGEVCVYVGEVLCVYVSVGKIAWGEVN